MANNTIIAERIKKIRHKNNLTQREFAEKIGTTPATISAYENGMVNPSVSIIMDIAKTFDLTMDWICGEEEKELEIKTVSDFIKALISINKVAPFEIVRVPLENFDPYESDSLHLVFYDTLQNHIIDLDSWVSARKFLEEWITMLGLKNTKTINDELYNLWLKTKITENSNKEFFNQYRDSDELPF